MLQIVRAITIGVILCFVTLVSVAISGDKEQELIRLPEMVIMPDWKSLFVKGQM